MAFASNTTTLFDLQRRLTIYGLIDPRDGTVRYIGKTVRFMRQRLNHHETDKAVNLRCNWLRKLKRLGLRARIVPLIETTVELGDEEEMALIGGIRAAGGQLLNMTFGGEGFVGRRMSAKQIEDHRQRNLGKTLSEEHRRKISVAHMGKTIGLRQRQKIGDFHRGHKCSDITRKRMSESIKLQWGSLTSEEKAKRIEKVAELRRAPEVRAKQSEKAKKRYSDPVERQKMQLLASAWHSNPENKANHRAAIRTYHGLPPL